MATYVQKTAAEVEDFTINWASRGLGADSIQASSWAVAPADLAINSVPATNTSTTATVWLSGGTSGVNYAITNTINTKGGRTFQQTFYCSIA